jgi:hypothetical protein
MAAEVTRIAPRERVWLDPHRIETIYAQFGGAEAQALLERAMNEVYVIRHELAQQYEARDFEAFARNLRRLRRIGQHLGMPMISRISEDVGRALAAGDATAMAATWARLRRSADQALSGEWEVEP